jgi:error-prone DNA polymerase
LGRGSLPEERLSQAGFDPENREIARLREMVDRLLTFPRHLSQHVGGFVLCESRLDELVPIHNAGMDNRTFIEWDKDDIDVLGLMKVDVLALGMLTCIRKSFDLMERHGLGRYAWPASRARTSPRSTCCAGGTASARSRWKAARRWRCCRA